MGSMIDSAEKDPSLGLLHMNDHGNHQAEMRSVDAVGGANNARSGTGGGSMVRGTHNNASYIGWGGSGESTGGSARHY